MEKVKTKVNSIISDVLSVPVEKLNEDTHLIDDIGAESVDFVDIIFEIEQGFNIKINDPENMFPTFLIKGQNPFSLTAEQKESNLKRILENYSFVGQKMITDYKNTYNPNLFFTLGYLYFFTQNELNKIEVN